MRITGLATGLDVDQVVTDTMKPYRIRVDKTIQNKEVVEIKQKLYRDIMADASNFYDKFFDVAKSSSMLNSKNYRAISFTSSNENIVSVRGASGAKAGNYTITGEKATAARAVLSVDGLTEIEKDGEKYKQITVNGKSFDIKVDTEKAMATDLNNQLKKAGMNVSVRYSEMAGSQVGDQVVNGKGFVFESTVLGEDATFTIGGSSTIVGTSETGKNATAAQIKGFSLQDIKRAGKFDIGGTTIDLGITPEDVDEDIMVKLNLKLSDYKFKATKDDAGNITLTATEDGAKVEDPAITIDGVSSIVFEKGTDATKSTVKLNSSSIRGENTLIIAGNTLKVDFSKVTAGKEAEYLNDLFKKNNIGVVAEIDGATGEMTLTSKTTGESSKFELQTVSADTSVASGGKDAEILIKDDKGGIYKHTGNSNNITLDDITFSITGEIPKEGITVTGKVDVSQTKDMLVNFINEYNTLIEKLNTLTMTKHDKSYTPLTADQKKEMSETEIKLWNERVEKGQLYKDMDLTRITNSLKSTMRSVMEGTGLSLESIGIVPVKDYSGTKNGTFSIDEDKLTEALQENIEDVMNLFIGKQENVDSTSPSYMSKTGIVHQLKDTLYKEFKSSASSLSNKVGLEGTSTFSNNELTRSISNYERRIKDLEKDLSKREQALYSKYATLETMMNKLNAQQANLASQLGLS